MAAATSTTSSTSLTARPRLLKLAAAEPERIADTEGTRASIRKLADLDPATYAPGHLGPLTGPDVREQLERAATA